MKLYCLALLFISVSAEKHFTTLKDLRASGESRIIDGYPAQEGQFPWQVGVTFRVGDASHFCGGALISDQWVLTAAHCAHGASTFTLRFGSLNQQEGEAHTTTEAIVHAAYNDYLNNDVAVIKLQFPITITDNIKPIDLPEDNHRVGVGEVVRVSGWGRTVDGGPVSPKLNYVDLQSIDNYDCAKIYGTSVIVDSTLCCVGIQTEKQSPCNGDSGSPLNKNGIHVGITSFVHNDGCASGNPSGFVRTASMRAWIREHTGV